MKTTQIIETQTGVCNADSDLRNALHDAIRHNTSTVEISGREFSVRCTDDESSLDWNEEAIYCAILEISDKDTDAIHVGYYSDGAQHVLDIVPAETSVQDWSRDWDCDGMLPQYLTRRMSE